VDDGGSDKGIEEMCGRKGRGRKPKLNSWRKRGEEVKETHV
jgi:hypothetical protein